MKKALAYFFIFLPLLLAASFVFAVNVPEFEHKEPIVQREFENVGQEIQKARLLPKVSSTTLPSGSTQYIQNRNTLQSGASFYVQNGTIAKTDDARLRIVDLTDGTTVLIRSDGQDTSIDISAAWFIRTGSVISSSYSVDGSILQPNQPSCLARSDATQSNSTGDGTLVTVVFGTEVYDQGSDCTSDTFTAPVTGRYLFTVQVDLDELSTASHTEAQLRIATSNRTYLTAFSDIPTSLVRTSNLQISVIADMDASDTATFGVDVAGASKVVDIIGSLNTRFSVSLIN